MNLSYLRNDPPVAQVVGIAMLAWALAPFNPYGYYVFLRIVVCGVFACLAVKAYQLGKPWWMWGLTVLAALYNPIIRIHLDRELWSAVNLATIGVLTLSIWFLKSRRISNPVQIAPRR